uniref:RNA-binding protein 33-like n=1 Tax=Monopterus albus TaxID=43700 RepID=UPI0009B463AD|nr:RNA-binding protein 33-like [Monopterus albus]
MPTIHVNVNSYPTDGQWIQQDRSLPHTNSANSNAPRSHTEQVYPRRQSGQFYPSDPRLNGYIDTDLQAQPDLIPTGYTHYNSNNTSQRNANTQTYQQDMDHRSRSDRRSESHSATPSSSLHQMPWDRLRGTPAYHSSTLQREQFSPEYTSDNTDYTTHPPIPESRSVNRSRPQPWNQTASRSRNPTRQNAPPVDRRKRTRSADPHSPNTRHLTQLEATPPTHRGPRTQSESAQQDIRGLPGSQTAPRQEAHVLQQQREAPIRKPPEDLGTQIIHGVRQPRQGDTVPYPSAQPDPRNLTQAALKAHTDRTQIFHNRKQQTQAALLHPGTQHQAPAAGAEHPPTPPPVIPLTQFKTIPKDRTQHKSPTRGPQPSRPPVNMPVAHGHQQHRPNVHHHPAAHHHHHRPGNGHMHAPTNRHAHAPTHRHPADFSHPQQINLFLGLVVEVQSVCLDHSSISLPVPCSHLYVTSDEQSCCSPLETLHGSLAP